MEPPVFSWSVHVTGRRRQSGASANVVQTQSSLGARVREAHFEDYEQIASLESRFGLAVKSHEAWVHLWKGNPLYRELKTDWPIGWVLEDGDGKIVGSMGNIPLLYEFDGRRVIVASGRHWVADPAYRSVAILLLHNLISQRRIDLYLNTTVSDASVPAVVALGCSQAPVGVWDEVAYWITNYFGCLQSVMAAKNPFASSLRKGSWTHLKAIGTQLSGLPLRLFSAAALKNRLTKRAGPKPDIEVTACAEFDDRFDRFWEELRKKNRQVLLAVRSRESLQWHFKHAAEENRLWITTVVDGSRLIAYAIFCKVSNLSSGITQVKLVDYQSLDNSPTMLEPILAWTLERCRSEGIHMLEHTGRWLEKGEWFDEAAPYRRKLPAWQYFYRVHNPTLRQQLGNKHAWAPSLFDGDATL
jgi:hypothetical protein